MKLATALVLLASILAVTGCCIDPVNGSRYFCLSEMSAEEEAQLGAQYAPNFIAQSGGVYPDPQLHSYLENIVIDQMALKSHRSDLPWTFEILNTSALNAFALPGGRVFVTRGLLAKVESEAQFAHLMGHEIGHVSHRHALKGQGRAMIFGSVQKAIDLVEEEIPFETPGLVTGAAAILGTLTLRKYSRDQELESDERGIDYALAAGYDPREATKTFETFLREKAQRGQRQGLVEGLLSTHPLDKNRIRGIGEYLDAQYPEVALGGRELVVSPPSWDRIRTRIRADQVVYEGYDEALALVARARKEENQQILDEAELLLRRGIRKLPRHAAFHVAMAEVARCRFDETMALQSLDKALGLDPRSFDASYLRGIVHSDLKHHADALRDLTTAHRLYPVNPRPCLRAGGAAQALGNRDSAADWYRKAIERSPAGSDLRRQAEDRLSAL